MQIIYESLKDNGIIDKAGSITNNFVKNTLHDKGVNFLDDEIDDITDKKVKQYKEGKYGKGSPFNMLDNINKIIPENLNDYTVEYNVLINEGLLDNIKNAVNDIDKRKWLKYAVIAYLSALGIHDYNNKELDSEVNKAIHQEISVLDIRGIAKTIAAPFKSKENKPDTKIKKTDKKIVKKSQYNLMHDLSKPVKISSVQKNKIKDHEKLVLTPYYAKINDGNGNITQEKFLTVGYGHKVSNKDKYKKIIKPNKPITKELAEEIFNYDIETKVENYLPLILSEFKDVGININNIPQHALDVMGDMIFNGGIGNFRKSGFYKTLLNTKSFDKAGQKISKDLIYAKVYDEKTKKYKYVIQPGLVKRAKERQDNYYKNFNKNINNWER